jgi:hypothetical protein
MLASDSSRREIASSLIALSCAANVTPAAVRGWAWTGCRFFLARKMELADGGVRLWAMCHLQIAALRSFVGIPSSIFPRSHAAYGPLDVLRPKAEGGGFFGEMGRPPMLVLDTKNALSRSSTSPSISPAVTRIPFCACGQARSDAENVVAVSLGILCGMGRRHPIAVGAQQGRDASSQPCPALEKDWEGVSAAILEGLDEMLTVTKLRLPPELRRSLACTNIIENVMGTVRRVSRNVKYWRSPSMALRWAGAAMQEAAKGFRRLKDYKQLPLLQAALAVRKARATSSNANLAQR